MLFEPNICKVCGNKIDTSEPRHIYCEKILLGVVAANTLRFISNAEMERRLLYYKEY